MNNAIHQWGPRLYEGWMTSRKLQTENYLVDWLIGYLPMFKIISIMNCNKNKITIWELLQSRKMNDQRFFFSCCVTKSVIILKIFSVVSGGMFTGLPDKVNRSWILTDDCLKYFAEMYSKTGFRLGKFWAYNKGFFRQSTTILTPTCQYLTAAVYEAGIENLMWKTIFITKSSFFVLSSYRGPLNWYRTMEKDWQWNCKMAGRKVILFLSTGTSLPLPWVWMGFDQSIFEN